MKKNFFEYLYLDYEESQRASNEAPDESAKDEAQKRFEYRVKRYVYLVNYFLNSNQENPDARAKLCNFVAKELLRLTNEGCSENNQAAGMNNNSCLSRVTLKVSDMVTPLFISVRDFFFTTISCIPLAGRLFSNKAAMSGFEKFLAVYNESNFLEHLYLNYKESRGGGASKTPDGSAPDGSVKEEA